MTYPSSIVLKNSVTESNNILWSGSCGVVVVGGAVGASAGVEIAVAGASSSIVSYSLAAAVRTAVEVGADEEEEEEVDACGDSVSRIGWRKVSLKVFTKSSIDACWPAKAEKLACTTSFGPL